MTRVVVTAVVTNDAPALFQAVGWHNTLRRSAWREVGVMAIVIMLGGWLAYVSPNAPEAGETSADSLTR